MSLHNDHNDLTTSIQSDVEQDCLNSGVPARV